MINISHREITDNGIDYIGHISFVNESFFQSLMEQICEENNVSIFWGLELNGNFFISIDFCPAKICNGGLNII